MVLWWKLPYIRNAVYSSNISFHFQDILYLHNTIIHRFNPIKNLHRHCFRFPWGHLHVPGEIANNDYAKFGGVKEVYYGICASREFKFLKYVKWPSDDIIHATKFWSNMTKKDISANLYQKSLIFCSKIVLNVFNSFVKMATY